MLSVPETASVHSQLSIQCSPLIHTSQTSEVGYFVAVLCRTLRFNDVTRTMFLLHSYSMSAKTGSRVVATFHRIAADLAGLQINNRHLRSVAGVLQVAVEKDEAPSLSGSHVCSDSVETEPVAKVPDNQESDAQDALLQGPCCLNVTRMGKFTARTLCIFAQKLRKLYNRPKSWWLRRQAYK